MIGDLIDLGDFGISCQKKYISPRRTDLLTGNLDEQSTLKTNEQNVTQTDGVKDKKDESLLVTSLRDCDSDVEESLQILDLNQVDSTLSSTTMPLNSSLKELRDSKNSNKEGKSMSPLTSVDLFSINELDLGFIGIAPEISEEESKQVQFSTPNLPTTTPGKSPFTRMVRKFATLSLVTPTSSKFNESRRVADLSSIYRPNESSTLPDERNDSSVKDFKAILEPTI